MDFLNKKAVEEKVVSQPEVQVLGPEEVEEIKKKEIKEKTELAQQIEKETPKIAPQILATPITEKQKQFVQQSELVFEIKKILSEGLDEFYQSMPETLKQKFDAKGIETATKIEKIVISAKVKIHQIIKLIIDWLKMIPGVNKLFLEQESKIKTDKILLLTNNKKKQKLI